MKRFVLLSLMTITYLNILGQKKDIVIAPTPNWIESVENLNTNISQSSYGNSGYYYHLIDFQTNIDNQSFFSHYTVEILNNEGIQQISDLNVDFDPSYQKLIFHRIDVIRNRNLINKLDKKDIKTVQRESNMERFLYDGTITAFINLTDVRKGDIIDYSYTIIGSNPVYENKYHGKIYFQHVIPVGLLHHKLHINKDRKLNFKYFNSSPEANVRKDGNIITYQWKLTNLESIIYDKNTPSWYDPIPNVSISEYDTWKKVINQYNKHYRINQKNKKLLKRKVEKLFENVPKDSILEKIRIFVQDDIRYLGFEGGFNSHIPTCPNQVFDQRYGDCKSKSFLLAETLKMFGIEANPILVHSYNGKNIPEELPSPNIFNHCIVQVVKNEITYYIDPTISNQGGTIENLYTPDYKVGLLLEEGAQDLTKINFSANNNVKILEEYDIDKIGGTAYVYITTKYSGASADEQREFFAKRDRNKISKEYLNFYSALYPSIREFSKIEFIDHRSNKNEITVKEAYFIDSLWIKSQEDEHVLYSEFYPLNLESHINVDKSPERTMPYYIRYPVDLEHKIVINLPEDWNVTPERSVIEDENFRYTYNVEYLYRKINLNHTYKTFKNYIYPETTSNFIANHEKIRKNLSYILTYNTNAVAENNTTSWILILLAIVSLGIFVFFAIRIFTSYNIQGQNSKNESQKIGGWLILVAIGITITPIRTILELYREFDNFFSTSTWMYIIKDHSSFNELFNSLLIIVEIIYNSAFLVFSILIIVLFYFRRTILPRLFIIFYVATFIFILTDTILALILNKAMYSEVEKMQLYQEIGRSFISMAIWVPYFLISKRVKSTFTEVYTGKKIF
ncbi:DUF3857 domain-containing protein [Aquimarina sp. U1-2]|uniref:DUF3857 domain-containing protein n=1 Tax=Aquimarina sp. U1-2 TaxID=2823141 RepID=UPI001AECAD41|nr:DUF3857 domain-containing protein [Aquimarina sp. U1-2]MBP2832552.1 DUF3857 domain-containing protein [Aquimarina sp. U1-2]